MDEKVLRKRNGKLASVYAWAVDYKAATAKEQKSVRTRSKSPARVKEQGRKDPQLRGRG